MDPEPGKPKANRIGLERDAYTGGPSTLCPGCGHDSITQQIIAACYEVGLWPHRLAKVSGIGCSSKTPGYFLSRSHGINGTHGRMPSLATGIHLANRSLKIIGVSGDGDTASIGLGQFCHLLRRNVEMIYLIENNGVYGLTKGQFSATADLGSVSRSGEINEQTAIDCCSLAIEMGCGFVARSFSADRKQMVALLKAALVFPGTCVIDVISPCVTFNDHPESTKSYSYVKQHDLPLHELDVVEERGPQEEIEMAPGEVRTVVLSDEIRLRLRKIDEDYDPTDRARVWSAMARARDSGDILTGLIFLDRTRRNFVAQCNLVDRPLVELGEDDLRLSRAQFKEVMDQFS